MIKLYGKRNIMPEMINLAIIGAGYWGTKLIGEYHALSTKQRDVKLCAIADSSPQKLSELSRQWNFPSSMLKKDYNEIIEDPKIVAVHIATPNETHYEIARKAIDAGKHVLLEKPMSLRASEALKLARFAEKTNSVLLIGHIFRFNNAVNKIKDMIEKGEIDETRYVELRWTTSMHPLPNRDIIFDLAPHPIDILNHLFEEWPTQVYVNARSYERKEVGLEEVAFATLDFPRDIMALMVLSWVQHGPRQRTLNIVNKKNALRVEAVQQNIALYENGHAKEIPIKPNNTIESEINHFIGRIKNNDPPINSALTGVMNVTVLDALRKSLQTGNVTSTIGM